MAATSSDNESNYGPNEDEETMEELPDTNKRDKKGLLVIAKVKRRGPVQWHRDTSAYLAEDFGRKAATKPLSLAQMSH